MVVFVVFSGNASCMDKTIRKVDFYVFQKYSY
jgi:hypothetical protein